MKDLVILVADKNMEHAIEGLLGRPRALNIRQATYDIYVHSRRDPGCLNEAHNFLRPFLGEYDHALVMFDHQGCGREQVLPDDLADEVKARLEQNGWPSQAEVVVLAPELEVWVWSASPHVETCLGWTGHHPPLREWLADNGHWALDEEKPPRPKETMEAALREVRKPRSSAIYLELAQRVSLQGHTEPAFVRFTQTLQRWYARDGSF
jgi:hypothetical protein